MFLLKIKLCMLLFYHFSLREYLWKSGLFGNSPYKYKLIIKERACH